ALELLVERHERRLYACALALLGSRWDAGDALQDALLEVCAKIGTLSDAGRFRPWVTRILINKCYDSMRRRRREVTMAEVAAQEMMPDAQLDAEADYDLLAAVRALDEQRRLAIALRYFIGLDYQQIAQVTGWPLGSVKSRISRALAHLHATLQLDKEP
ncbi:MAG TPA: sigma-70 family RNA polymerase sigma factor, partial [Thermoleophilia bacterium]|nr:sigma-70 family RNA polymerase sigma factor [Thermoleophilia bacterium]